MLVSDKTKANNVGIYLCKKYTDANSMEIARWYKKNTKEAVKKIFERMKTNRSHNKVLDELISCIERKINVTP